jgi:hypothetical protein
MATEITMLDNYKEEYSITYLPSIIVLINTCSRVGCHIPHGGRQLSEFVTMI